MSIYFANIFPLEPEDPEESDIASFEILDPDYPETRSTYCVGFKYQGGDLTQPENWTYDHTNFWLGEPLYRPSTRGCVISTDYIVVLGKRHQSLKVVQILPMPWEDPKIPREELDALLEKHGATVNDLLKRFLEIGNQF